MLRVLSIGLFVAIFQVACDTAPRGSFPALPAQIRLDRFGKYQVEKRQVPTPTSLLPVCTPEQLNEPPSCAGYKVFGWCGITDNVLIASIMANCDFTCGRCREPPPVTTAPPVCIADTSTSQCKGYKRLGLCDITDTSNFFFQFLAQNCNATCGECEPPTTMAPTTERPMTPSTMAPSSTMAPPTEPPSTMAPPTEPPSTMAPSTEPPSTMAPPTEPPSTMAPPTEPPSTMAPSTEPPSTMAPPTEPPSTMAPPTELPSTMAPRTEPPSTMAPPTELPSTMAPFTLSPEDAAACLQYHNAKRTLHGSPELTWSDVLAQHAQTWADHLAATETFVHERGITEGENLYWSRASTARNCSDAVESWYSEELLYDYDRPPQTIQEFLERDIGHFTQIVWKGTTMVGVGIATVVEGNPPIQTYIVARYAPPGNVIGRFAENVMRPVVAI